MNLSDWIQPAILAVLATTVIVAVLHLRTQNRLLKASVRAARLQTYWPENSAGHATFL